MVTDGSCKRSGGPGGWAYLIMDGPEETLGFGFDRETTNNRMEMMGVLAALRLLHRYDPPINEVTLVCDSEYVLNGITDWMEGWRVRQWRTSTGKHVKNVDLWKEMSELVKTVHLKPVHVKGHVGHPENEICDAIAALAREYELDGTIFQCNQFDRDVRRLKPYVAALYGEDNGLQGT